MHLNQVTFSGELGTWCESCWCPPHRVFCNALTLNRKSKCSISCGYLCKLGLPSRTHELHALVVKNSRVAAVPCHLAAASLTREHAFDVRCTTSSVVRYAFVATHHSAHQRLIRQAVCNTHSTFVYDDTSATYDSE